MMHLKTAFVVIRHGQTDANRDGRIAGRIEAQLTPEGRSAACALPDWMWPKTILLFSSPQQRARDTAHLGFPEHDPIVLNGLRERDWGVFEGRPVSELPPRDQTPKGGEPWPDMLQRVADAVTFATTEAQRHGPSCLPVLVAHSGVIRAVRHLTGGTAHGPSPVNTTPYLFAPGLDDWDARIPDKKDKSWIV
ncbi:histidine phosphatase family protein [Pacificibacter marinus]|uniref:Bifunctional RNase H/acid phosphatase n=1 Tax=Pacificibacter marinus TaxID=658057 RepID=A0A1Y5T5X9_9RHOB|nr:histidine phosphatase family protein [Pacificibacter marinus]SEL21373.1 probable phosphoglycerate mutase [Pacificibacter marinus]SLN56020.1 bifunctional RNase H/acid phosphatase [Pacificibacter marinus]